MIFHIGKIKIDNQIVLAPMAGISNTSYRKIIKSMGAGLIFAEMVSDKALVFENKKTYELLKMDDYERPIAQQIFGSDVETYVQAAKLVEDYMHPDIIDINMGCPVPKVAIKSQAGSALLKNPEKIYDIVSEVVKAVNVPVTVKIRSGWDENSINAVEVAKIIEKAGASAITVHPRTRKQGYSGKADWNIIKEVKENVNIPVIGNGDATSCYLAKQMLEETKCDAVMIGRGVLGNPWIFRDCINYIDNNIDPIEISVEERVEMIKKHFELLKQDKNEKIALLEMRSHATWYIKGIPNSKKYRNQICAIQSQEELYNVLDLILKDNNNML